MLGGSASLTLPAAPLPPSSRRYAPQCFVGEYTSSPCDVSHRASDEPRRRMSLSSALAPSSLASPSHRRVCLRSSCARRRPVGSLNLVRVSPGAKRSRRRRAQCGVQIHHVVRGASLRRPISRSKWDLAGKDPKDSDDFDRELRNSSNFFCQWLMPFAPAEPSHGFGGVLVVI